MRSGGKPKPTVLKMLAGNPGKRPLNKEEPQPRVSTADAPPGLSADAQKHWDLVASQLYDCGLLTDIDKPALVQYCEAYSRWYDANEQIKQFGTVIKSPNGFPVQSPYLAISNKAFEQMSKLLVEFGMTPSSRTRIKATPKAKTSGVYDNLDYG